MHYSQIAIHAQTSDKVDAAVIANMVNYPGNLTKSISKDPMQLIQMVGDQKGEG